jgi:deazaflavin-dependent oxidoreductase (nitroreductase family)
MIPLRDRPLPCSTTTPDGTGAVSHPQVKAYRAGMAHEELADASDDDFCYLTTRGRITGDPHEIEIWFALDETTLFMLSGGGSASDWVQNLQAAPSVTVRVRDRTYDASARVLEPGTGEDARARQLVYEKYQPRYSGSLDDWRERSLPVAIDLDAT